MRQTLAARRDSAPLFDTACYCRDLESAYRRMSEQQRRGERPRHFTVD
jgi:predicted O-linked N-acetylglucosamine transferase (SPINDLY family)